MIYETLLPDMQLETLTAADGMKATRIVLTTAHLDHTPENCSDDNLASLCQRCHLNYDREIHIRNRAYFARLRKEKEGQQSFI